jgi:hypothetical protein
MGTASATRNAQPVSLEGHGTVGGAYQGSQDVIDDNVFRSNDSMIRTGGYDGSGHQRRQMVGNQFDWVDGDTAKDDFITALNAKLTALEADFLAHRFVQAETEVTAAIAQINSLLTGVPVQSSKQFWWAFYSDSPNNIKVTAPISDSIFGAGVTPESIAYTALRAAPASFNVATQYTYQIQDPENANAPIPNTNVTATNNVGDVFTLRSDGSGNVSVPIIEYAMDKPVGVNQPFAKVNRTSTTLTATGYDPWVLTHSEL